MPRNIQFSPEAFAEFNEWGSTNAKVHKKLLGLLTECCRTPFEGTGKPEGLKGNYKGYWSRRMTDEHRLIYRVTDETVYVVSYHGHYS